LEQTGGYCPLGPPVCYILSEAKDFDTSISHATCKFQYDSGIPTTSSLPTLPVSVPTFTLKWKQKNKKPLMSLENLLKPAVALVLSRVLSQILLQIFFACKL